MKKLKGRERRHKRLRKKVSGTAVRPRMVLYRSLKNMNVQLVDDIEQKTLLSLSTCTADIKKGIGYGGNVKAAAALGELLAKKALGKGVKRVVFDRSGYDYHGRVKAIAESAKKGGLSFGKEQGTAKTDGKKG